MEIFGRMQKDILRLKEGIKITGDI